MNLGVGVVGIPGCTKGLLATEVPHDEVDVLPDHLLDIGADGGRGVHHLIHEELVEYRGLPGIVQPNEDNLVLCE